MESSNLQCASSILNCQNKRKAKEEENIKAKKICRRAKNFYQINSRSRYLSSCSPQSFSLPDSIMYYISKNPTTAKLYQKIIQTCKYFFIKNPIIVSPKSPYSYHLGKLCIGKTRFDLSQLICKFWVTEDFDYSLIFPKLYKCDAKRVELLDEIISFNDLSMFTKTAEDITFIEVTIKDSEGSIVPFEKIFEIFIYVKKFRFDSELILPNITSKTFNELSKIPHFSQLKSFYLNNIPDTFDIEAFYVYMKKNKTTKFWLEFHESISVPYKTRLEAIIDEILGTKKFNYKPPMIDFDGLENAKKFRLYDFFVISNV